MKNYNDMNWFEILTSDLPFHLKVHVWRCMIVRTLLDRPTKAIFQVVSNDGERAILETFSERFACDGCGSHSLHYEITPALVGCTKEIFPSKIPVGRLLKGLLLANRWCDIDYEQKFKMVPSRA